MSCLVHRADVVVGKGCQQVGREGICSFEMEEEEEEEEEEEHEKYGEGS